MKIPVKIQGKTVFESHSNGFSRAIANRIYETLADLIFTGTSEDLISLEILKKYYNPTQEFKLTVSGIDWEEMIAECDWICNRKRQAI